MKNGLLGRVQALFLKNRDLTIIACIFLLCCFFYLLFPVQYKSLLNFYMLLLMQGASILLSVFQINYSFDSTNISFVFDGYIFKPDLQFAALRYSFISIGLPLVFLRLTTKGKILFLVFAILFVYSLNCTRIFFVLNFISLNHRIPGIKHDLVFHAFLLALPLGSYIWQARRGWSDFLGKNTNPDVTILHKLLGAILLFSFLKYVYSFSIRLIMNSNWILDSLTFVILSISKFLLSQFSFVVNVKDRILSDAFNSIYMGDPCVGLNIMIVFIIVLFISKGKILHKVLYALTGLALIIFLNVVRVTLLFAYLKEAKATEIGVQDLHDDYNIVIYIFVFLLWAGWFYLEKKLSMQKISQK
jgi:exosortase/archaeosortase family protein